MEAEQTQSSSLLMLDQPRVIAIRDGGRIFTFHFRRIMHADWDRYYKGIYSSSRSDNGAEIKTLDLNTAGVELFENTLCKVEGYSRVLISKEDFEKVLPRHALPVSWLLRRVSVSDEVTDAPPDPDLVEARLEALWSQTEPGAETTLYKGLVHRLAPATAEHKKKFLRGGAMSKVVGGSRQGTTIFSSRNTLLVEIYDQLIRSVDGYGVNGKPLSSPEEIRREMDMSHKIEAAGQLFNALPEVEEKAA